MINKEEWKRGRDTAPKDGTPIWAWLNDCGIRLLRYGTKEEWADIEGGKPDDYQDCWVEVQDESEVWGFDFWLPYEAIELPKGQK